MKKILCIEDDFNSQMLLKIYFRGDKYKLTIVTNGGKALRLLEEQSFDLILSDWNLNGILDKVDLVEAIRSIPLKSHTPIVIITADNGLSLTHLIESAKVQKVLHKPVLKKQLLAEVDQLLLAAAY